MSHEIEMHCRAGKEPEARYNPDGKLVVSLSVASTEGYGDNKSTAWFRLSFWEKDAEFVNQYVKKGHLLFIKGRLNFDKTTGGPRIYKRRDGTDGTSFEVKVREFELLTPKGDNTPAPVEEDGIPF